MSNLVRDIRFAVRMLVKSPGLAAVAIITLAVAIGANATIFSVVNAVILQPLPYSEPDRLVRIHSQFPSMDFDRFWVSPPEYWELRDRNQAFSSVAAWAEGGAPVAGGREPVRVPAAYTTGPFFETLGVAPMLGSTSDAVVDLPGDPTVVVLGHSLWQRIFSGDPEIIGRRIRVDGYPVTVLAVMPESFRFPNEATEIWIPFEQDPKQTGRGNHFLSVIARMAPGVSLAQARSDMAGFMAWSVQEYGEAHANHPEKHPLIANSLYQETVAPARISLLLLQGAVLFVLLIAAANLSSLLLARAEARSKEIAIRAALGARRGRIVRQLLTEAMVLGTVGALFGLGLAVWGVDLTVVLLPENAPRRSEIGIDGWVLAVGVASGLVTSLLFGLAPALWARGGDLHGALKEAGIRATGGRGRRRLRGALVVAETALAVVLVIACGLMLRSFSRVQEVDLGFDPDRLVTMQIELPRETFETSADVGAFWQRLEQRVAALPGVESRTLLRGLPPNRRINANDIFFEGLEPPPPGSDINWNVDFWQIVGDDYFATMGIRIVEGRGFDPRDRDGTLPVALVNETMAARFWGGASPIGRRIRVTQKGPLQTVVGIVADVKQQGIAAPTGTEVYLPLRQVVGWPGDRAPRLMNVMVKASGDPRSVIPGVRRFAGEVDPNLPVANVKMMDEVLWEAVSRPRFFAVLLGIFALLALMLAAIGIFGVMAYTVAQRTRELGIRMALGASPSAVRKMVLASGMKLVAIGIVLGVVASVFLSSALSRVLGEILFEVEPLDTTTFVVVPILIAAVGLLACWLPALKATRLDPMIALRRD